MILFCIGSALKCRCLMIPIMPCAIIVSILTLLIAAIEFPMVSVTADACSELIRQVQEKKLDEEKCSDLASVDGVMCILKNCSASDLNNQINKITGIVDDIPSTGIEMYNDVCSNIGANYDAYNDEKKICKDQTTACLEEHASNGDFEKLNPINCEMASSNYTDPLNELTRLINTVSLDNYAYYYVLSKGSEEEIMVAPLHCSEYKDSATEANMNYQISGVGCNYLGNLTIEDCKGGSNKNCPKEFSQYAAQIVAVKDILTLLKQLLDLLEYTINQTFSCNKINSLLIDFKEGLCYDMISAEPFFLVGLFGYIFVLLTLYVFSFLAIKRAYGRNFEKEDTRYYADGEYDMDEA